MNSFFRYVFRSHEGLRSYLMYLGAVMGTVFLVYMIILINLLADGTHDEQIFSLYEITGTVFAGIGCVSLTDRLLRICISFGISRKTFLRGMLHILPMFAAITTVMIQLTAVLTDGIFRLSKNSLDFFVLSVCSKDSCYLSRVFILNLTITFCLCIAAFGVSLLYTGCKKRFHMIVGSIAAGICSYIGIRWIQERYDHSCGFTTIGSLFEFIMQMIVPCMDPMGCGQHIPFIDSFYLGIVLLIIYTAALYLVMYAVFSFLTKRTEICGKEQGGQI